MGSTSQDQPVGSTGQDQPSRPEGDQQYPLMTNQAGALVVDPVLRVRVGVVLMALAIVLGSGAAAYVSTSLAGENTDRRAEQLLAELDRRTAERRMNEARAVAILEQNRRTLCSIMRESQHRSDDLELRQLYVVYHCGTAPDPVVPPGWRPPPGWPALPPGPDGFRPSPTPSPTG